MKLLILLFSVLLSSSVLVGENVVSLHTKITDAVIYPSGAQISRIGNVQLQSGANAIVIKSLPASIDAKSVQIIGNGDYTILSVTHQYNYLEEKQKTAELANILSRIDSVEQAITLHSAYLSAYQEQQNMLIKNQYIGGENIGIKTIDLKEASDFHLAKMTEVKLKQVELQEKINRLNMLKNKFALQQTEIKSKITKATSEIWVSISASSTQKTNLILTYFEPHVSWTPFYDLRVKDINEPLKIDYKAKIIQNTGEDWNDVQLTLSTSEPKSTAQMPYLNTWYLYFNNYEKTYNYNPYNNMDINTLPQYNTVSGKITDKRGESLIGVNVTAKGTTIGTVTDIDGYFTLQLPNGVKQLIISYVGYSTLTVPITSDFLNIVLQEEDNVLEEVVVTAMAIKRTKKKYYPRYDKNENAETDAIDVDAFQTPVDINFVIKNPYTITSSSKENVVDIKSEEVKPIYKYYAIPKLDKSVFLTANITNWESLNLLAGEANLYYQNTFIGRTLVNPAITEDTLMLSLGRDKNIVITREKQKEFSKKQFFSGDRVVNNAFSISLRNNKKQPIDITIYDQIPVSKVKEIKVELAEKSEASLDEETGKLTWHLFVEPSKEKKVQFGYSIKYPKEKTLLIKE